MHFGPIFFSSLPPLEFHRENWTNIVIYYFKGWKLRWWLNCSVPKIQWSGTFGVAEEGFRGDVKGSVLCTGGVFCFRVILRLQIALNIKDLTVRDIKRSIFKYYWIYCWRRTWYGEILLNSDSEGRKVLILKTTAHRCSIQVQREFSYKSLFAYMWYDT